MARLIRKQEMNLSAVFIRIFPEAPGWKWKMGIPYNSIKTENGFRESGTTSIGGY